MSALINLITMLITTAAAEVCVLRLCYPRRGLKYCIILVGVFSGIFWAAFSWTFCLVESSGVPVNNPPNVGSGADFATIFFVIWAVILIGAALIPAGVTAFIYQFIIGD
jgi:hypothetical protein